MVWAVTGLIDTSVLIQPSFLTQSDGDSPTWSAAVRSVFTEEKKRSITVRFQTLQATTSSCGGFFPHEEFSAERHRVVVLISFLRCSCIAPFLAPLLGNPRGSSIKGTIHVTTDCALAKLAQPRGSSHFGVLHLS